MRFLPFLLPAVIAFFSNACEKQPLPGDPDPRPKERASVNYGTPEEKREEPARRTGSAKTEEAPKFFPEKK